MNSIVGVWARPGVELSITRDQIVSKVLDPLMDERHTLRHDYLLETNRIQLYSPTVHEIKHAFKGELRIIMISPHTLTLKSGDDITQWERR